MLAYHKIQEHVIDKLTNGLSPELTYHNVGHTLDVLTQVIEIAEQEGIENDEDLLLLKVGALYHDTGFLHTYTGHEEISCMIAGKELPVFGFTKEQIEKIHGLIRATKIPQHPQTPFEEMICDSDLDYLGRNDFFTTGESLYKEFLRQKIVSNEGEWNALQVRFLESHHYFTNSSQKRRQPVKQMNMQRVKDKLI